MEGLVAFKGLRYMGIETSQVYNNLSKKERFISALVIVGTTILSACAVIDSSEHKEEMDRERQAWEAGVVSGLDVDGGTAQCLDGNFGIGAPIRKEPMSYQRSTEIGGRNIVDPLPDKDFYLENPIVYENGKTAARKYTVFLGFVLDEGFKPNDGLPEIDRVDAKKVYWTAAASATDPNGKTLGNRYDLEVELDTVPCANLPAYGGIKQSN